MADTFRIDGRRWPRPFCSAGKAISVRVNRDAELLEHNLV
jgi:hypothetical protein